MEIEETYEIQETTEKFRVNFGNKFFLFNFDKNFSNNFRGRGNFEVILEKL